MGNPFVYYRLDSAKELKRYASRAVRELDWHRDLAAIQRFYARFTEKPINPDEFDRTVGAPLAVIEENEIASFAIPLSSLKWLPGSWTRAKQRHSQQNKPISPCGRPRKRSA